MALPDWIKVESTTPRKNEVYEIASFLSINHYEALGRLIHVWIWVDANSANCRKFVVNLSTINSEAGILGFAEAMVKVGWLEEKNGKYSFPRFDRHNGSTAKKRAQDLRKKRETRAGQNEGQIDDEMVMPSSSTFKYLEDGGVGEGFDGDVPEKLDCDVFRKSWGKWRKYKKDQGYPVGLMQEVEILAKLATYSASQAVEVIDGTIRGGWKNLVYDLAAKSANHQTLPTPDEVERQQYSQKIPTREELKERDAKRQAATAQR